MCDETRSLSLVSTVDTEAMYTPTDQSTEDFVFIRREYTAGSLHWELSSTSTTSVSPSLYAHEFEHGRRYHAYKSGLYPLPNDIQEQQREDTKHAMMMELTVRI